MKSKITTIILFLIMLILMAGIIIFAGAIYLDLTSNNSEQVIYSFQDIATEEIKEEGEATQNTTKTQSISDVLQNIFSSTSQEEQYTYTVNEALSEKFFYNQLNDSEKIIYQGLEDNKQNLKQGTYVINFNDSFSSLLSQDNGSDLLGEYYQTAIEAFTHDNPEIFYLDVNKMYLNIETTTKLLKTTYNVYIAPANGQTYLSEDFPNTEQIEEIEVELEKIKNNVVSSLKGNSYQNIIYIHDYLVDSIEYDSTYGQIGSYSIYGALINKVCVCEGYAKAFKYLANAAGYECEILQGKATNSSGQTENHAWNCINVDGTWYQVDATWDDPIVVGNGKITNKIKYKYFLKGTDTFNEDHTISYQFSEGGKSFSYPTLSKEDY